MIGECGGGHWGWLVTVLEFSVKSVLGGAVAEGLIRRYMSGSDGSGPRLERDDFFRLVIPALIFLLKA